MKKLLNKFMIVVAASSAILPVTACTFNFYVDNATDAVIKSFADQTSSVVKSLVLGKTLKADTAQTSSDILKKYSNPSIQNLSIEQTFNNLGDFTRRWGDNNKIDFNGFDPTSDNYFVATGQGSLTQAVNAYKSTNNTLNLLRYATTLSSATNPLLYSQFSTNKDIRSTIFSFFNESKKTDPTQIDPQFRSIITFLKNLIIGNDWNNPSATPLFKDKIIDPITSLLNYTVDGAWDGSTPTTPANAADLKTYMYGWQDSDTVPYSNWVSGGSWGMDPSYYNPWNTEDYNFYRGGTLLNHLFLKIGKDYQISKPGDSYTDRYLGDIISAYVSLSGIDTDALLKDLEQYLPHILENPLYIITIAEAIIPVLKQYFLKMDDITKGVKDLTFGNLYPTNKPNNSYNLGDMLNNIISLINNPNDLKKVITDLLGLSPTGTPGDSFTYDIKINLPILGARPFGYITKVSLIGPIIKPKIEDLINNTILPLLTSDSVKGTLNNISNIYKIWIKQYNDKNKGIDMKLENLKDFLIGTNGLLTVINNDIVPLLKDIFTDPTPFVQAKYDAFYESLGGQLPPGPGQAPPLQFKANSVLDLLKNNIGDSSKPLGQISLILFGNSSQGTKGIFDEIIDSNNQWINDNYEKYFDVNNQSLGNTSNRTMTTTTQGGVISSKLKYNFSFKIQKTTYTFLILCTSHDSASSYKGTKTFYFNEIDLLSVVNK